MSETTEYLKKISDNVAYLLRNYPETRDKNMDLYVIYWRKYDGLGLATDLGQIDIWFKTNATPPETISRCRRKLQEENEDMRGEKYYQRHHEAAQTRKEISNLDMNKQPRLF